MTYYRTHFDRTDWRTMGTRALVEAARDSGHELAIALGERLEELDGADDALQEAREELREFDRRCDALRAELEEMHAEPMER